MKLEDQVCSLPLAKKLKELGVKQESLWYWCLCETDILMAADEMYCDSCSLTREVEHAHSAFTTSELGEIIQDPKHKDLNQYCLNAFRTKFKDKKRKWVIGDRFPLAVSKWLNHADTEANARAKMLVHLIEKGIVKPWS